MKPGRNVEKKASRGSPFSFPCVEHDRQLGGASPLHNVMDVK
jgi:hypothetical protein